MGKNNIFQRLKLLNIAVDFFIVTRANGRSSTFTACLESAMAISGMIAASPTLDDDPDSDTKLLARSLGEPVNEPDLKGASRGGQ